MNVNYYFLHSISLRGPYLKVTLAELSLLEMATASGFPLGLSGSRSGPSVTQPPSGIPGQAQPMVVVWEWQDDFGYWRPYSGQVSCYIEQCLLHQRGSRGGGPASTSISLGQSDPSLAAYIIDIPNLKQFRQDTGELTCRAYHLAFMY